MRSRQFRFSTPPAFVLVKTDLPGKKSGLTLILLNLGKDMEHRIQPGERLLFVGDSITDAFRKPEEINPAFQLGNGYVFLIASRLWLERPGDDLHFANRGVSGNRLMQVVQRWESDVLAWNPTVITLLIGVNDTMNSLRHCQAPEEGSLGEAARGGARKVKSLLSGETHLWEDETVHFGRRLRELLQSTGKHLPQVRLIVMEPFLLPAGTITAAHIADVRSRAAAVRQACQDTGAQFVPLQELLDEACRRAPASFWCYDGIHLTAAGFALVANAWLSATGCAPAAHANA